MSTSPIRILHPGRTVFTAQRAAAILALKWTSPQEGLLAALTGSCDAFCAEEKKRTRQPNRGWLRDQCVIAGIQIARYARFVAVPALALLLE